MCAAFTGVCTACRGDRISVPDCNCPNDKFDNGVDDFCQCKIF